LLVAVAALAFLSSCMEPAINDPARVGPFFQPRNVSKDPTLGGIRRVVLLPVYGGEVVAEESVAELDAIFHQALQQQNRFEVVTLSRDDCRRHFGATAFSSAGALPHDFLGKINRLFAADAVVFVDVTVYRAYHPLALGIRSKLAMINGERLVWTFDNVFSADNVLVSSSARHFYLESEHQNVPGDLTPSVLQSPNRFAAYVAYTTFATLPPVTLARLTETSNQQH
jgi:hypothetical protein